MKTELHKTRTRVHELESLNEYVYERIFKMYKDQGQFFAYNILKTVKIPDDLDQDTFYYYRVSGSTTWAGLSFNHYGSISLWWLICLASGITNPVKLPKPGTYLRIIKPEYVRVVIDTITSDV
tara:strand:+ start:39 stop:407 length:369 start_codon:yes stop_codon:yes gene_type:complete